MFPLSTHMGMITRGKLEKKQLPFATTFQLQKKIITKNCLVALNKLHQTLVAGVDEVNSQQILHHSYIIVCHLYITIKINNLYNDMWQFENGFLKIDLKIGNGSSLSNLNGFRL